MDIFDDVCSYLYTFALKKLHVIFYCLPSIRSYLIEAELNQLRSLRLAQCLNFNPK